MAGGRTTLTTVLQMNNTKFKKGLTGSQKALKAFQGQVKAVGASLAGAFSVMAIGGLAKQSLTLAMQLEGVAVAFNRIRPSVGFMNELKEATSGTVSELNLMKRAVMAANFNIPLEQMAVLLKFATKRAQETGESVDYLVNSIIMGIGRKSPLILDNLGISAVDLRNKLNNVGHAVATVADVAKAVGEIAAESMLEAGDVAETSAIKFERFKAGLKNMSAAIGEALLELPEKTNKAKESISKLFEGFRIAYEKSGIDWLFEGFVMTWDAAIVQTERYAESLKIMNTELDKTVVIFSKFEYIENLLRATADEFQSIYDRNDAIDWAEVMEGIYKQWLKENKIIAAQIELRKKLAEQIKENLDAQIAGIKAANEARAEEEANRPEPDTSGYENRPEYVPETREESMLTGLDRHWERAQEVMAKIEMEIEEFRNAMNNLLKGISTDAIVGFIDTIAYGLAQGGSGLDDIFNSILNQFGGFVSRMGAMFVAYGIAQLAFIESIKTMNPVGLIAAGAALVGIGAAISGFSQRAASGTFGGGSVGVAGSSNAYQDPTVNFKISGNDLVGVMDRQNYSNNMNT